MRNCYRMSYWFTIKQYFIQEYADLFFFFLIKSLKMRLGQF